MCNGWQKRKRHATCFHGISTFKMLIFTHLNVCVDFLCHLLAQFLSKGHVMHECLGKMTVLNSGLFGWLLSFWQTNLWPVRRGKNITTLDTLFGNCKVVGNKIAFPGMWGACNCCGRGSIVLELLCIKDTAAHPLLPLCKSCQVAS